MENKPLSLLELNSLVRRSITSCLPDEYWVQAELSDVRVNYSGHCYLEFVQKDATGNALLAKARGIIWANVFTRLRSYFERETGQAFVSGLILESIMADGQLMMYMICGKLTSILTAQKMCVMYMMRVWQSQVRFLAIQSAIIRYAIWKKR